MYQIEVRHDELNRYKVITGRDKRVVEEKARAQLAQWNEAWDRHSSRLRKFSHKEHKKLSAIELTADARNQVSERERILISGLSDAGPIDWDCIKSNNVFPAEQPAPRKLPDFPAEPIQEHPRLGIIDKLFASRRKRAEAKATAEFQARHDDWKAECDEILQKIESENAVYEFEFAEWQSERDEFYSAQNQENEIVDKLRLSYESGNAQSVIDYTDLVLSRSNYPDCFPREWSIDIDIDTGLLVAECRLPALSDMPTVKEVKYIASRDSFDVIQLNEKAIANLYDSVIYQTCLRTIYEIYCSDYINIVKSIVYNGWVEYTNPATGTEVKACIVSIQVTKDEYNSINFNSVDPKACFRSLKGVGSSQLHAMVPVQPLIQMNREDHRFVASMDVASRLDEGANLAAIGWEEFEHLIREIFERELSSSGGEVKVTQASRDGGVDAIAFDPDPIRGGKIVIQAKRYTNTVDVSSVRDLYGTVMNEGATKGILVTTSNFGPDAYNFAKDKPITLMDGSNLLFLLSKHGHKAHIDLREAKKLGQSMRR